MDIVMAGTGEQLDNLEQFEKKSFVSKLLGMGDIDGLMQKVKDLDMDEDKMMNDTNEDGWKAGETCFQLLGNNVQ